ncbi:MAG: ABC transporter substrate-binding protein, partial [Actinobacteria bacterium]|nr:ABC transporter substrate-binding protein [Actinomycetota bacterium]
VRGIAVTHHLRQAAAAHRTRLVSALICLLALVTAACGSTLSTEAQEQMAQAGGTFVAGTGPGSETTLPPGAHVNQKGQVVNAEGEVIGTVAGGGGTTSVASGGSQSGTTTAAPGTTYTKNGHTFGPGVTDTTIEIGVARNNDQRAGCEAAGSCDIMVNVEGMWDDFLDYYNDHGGIAGRKIKVETYSYSTSEAATQEQLAQRICTYFTQDHPVFIFSGIGTPNQNRCANNGGVSMVEGGQRIALDREAFNATPYVYLTGGPNLTSAGLLTARGLLESDYFDKPGPAMTGLPAKTGLLTYNDASHIRAAEEGFKATLASGGVEIDEQVNIYYSSGSEALARMDAEIQNAVLKFKSQNITHVTFLTADGGGLPLLFLRHAQDQNYFPRYGFNTSGAMATMVESGGQINVERRNFIGAIEVGWFPANDVTEGQKYQAPPRFAECKAIAEKYGYSVTTTNERIVTANICDFFQFIKDGIEAGLPDISPDSFLAGVESFGRNWAPAGPHQTFFSPGNHDGASAYQLYRYYESCSCVKPFGPITRFR